MMLVTLQSVSDYIRRDSDDDDALLTALIEASSEMVVNYLGSRAEELLSYDSNGNPPEDSNGVVLDVPGPVKAATKFLTAWLYRNRDENAGQAFQQGYLPAPVTAMLYPLRDPTLS